MKEIYTILRYNFYKDNWETMFSSDKIKLVTLKLRQYRITYKYFYFKLIKDVIIDV